MAMTGEIHTGVIILRTSVKQTISAAGWRMLFDEKNSINYDGEIMVFSHMSDLNQQHILDSLRSYGFLGPPLACLSMTQEAQTHEACASEADDTHSHACQHTDLDDEHNCRD